MGIIAGNIITAIPMVQFIINIVTAIGFKVIMASIMSGCSMEKIYMILEMESKDKNIIFWDLFNEMTQINNEFV
ncbi:hypothetical protein [Candidatus Nitrosocosmicus franklandus]|uniref:Uncharacterized protein n=1 Tax=Candidatus Nitrosocosmicus franklandianus TaxID=1798806 RepID=A0A484IFP4_9ARCH|nr:hypothetical protein [Candidatus Nitrosocosmicus franklandus]VFJ14831.1 protein of unknown function [Candidatus Nitrosocosmicus franklandus]